MLINCPFSAPKPIPYTMAEANALIYSRGISKSLYQVLRTQAKDRSANIYPAYNNLLEYRQNECTPFGIQFHDLEVIAPFQEILDHQLRRMFDDPRLHERVSALVESDPAQFYSFL